MKKPLLSFVVSLFIIQLSFSQVLELNLTVGESYYHDNISKIKMSQELQGEFFISEMSFGGKMRFLVKKKTDSLYDLEVEFQTLFYNMQSDDNEISASSQSVDSTDIFSSILKEMTKSPFDISITRHGIVEDVKMENLFENLFNLNPDIPRLERARIIYLTKQSFGEKAMKGSIEMLTAIYPSKPVEKGEEWKNQIRLETIFGETMENKFVLTELSNDFAIINVQSKTISDDNDSFIKTGDHLLRMKSTGSMSSTYKIDKNSGWIIESETHQDISGIIETKWREDSIIILKIPFEYNGSIKIKAE